MSNGLKLGFSSQNEEVDFAELPVRGQIPDWLGGTLLRNGSGKYEVDSQQICHWFDGFAMLVRFAFADGKVAYRNRFLQTNAYKQAMATKQIRHNIYPVNPSNPATVGGFKQQNLDNPNVNVARLDDQFVALGETVPVIKFDPLNLQTLGVAEYADSLNGQTTTAHPHYAGRHNTLFNFTTHFARASSYNFYYIEKGNRYRTLLAFLPVREPAYIHSFAMTTNYLILAEYPYVVNPHNLLTSTKPFMENFEWQPARGTKFIVINKHSGKLEDIYETDAFFALHHVNAYEEADRIILDLATYPNANCLRDLELEKLRSRTAEASALKSGQLKRFVLRSGKPSVDSSNLSEQFLELPRLNYQAVSGNNYRYVYGIGSARNYSSDLHNSIVKVAVTKGEHTIWYAPETYPGEPVFVAKPDAKAEDDGVLLSIVLDGRQGNSFLLVLNAADLTELARVNVPHHIPFGFHGDFYPVV
jgi:beta,beta-carotene 9',10'-dioxygenase